MRLNHYCRQKGFTMVEILMVIVIIGVLLSISIVTFNKAQERAKLARVKTNIGEIVLALSDYARDHNGLYPAFTDFHGSLPPPPGYQAIPPAPGAPVPGVPQAVKRRCNAIIGGGPMLVDTKTPLQDDFYNDAIPPQSLFRNLLDQPQVGDWTNPNPMKAIDVLARNGYLQTYPRNPFKGPGIPMVNVAHFLYDFDALTNDAQFVDIRVIQTGEVRRGLCAATPIATGVFNPIFMTWINATYPQGDFAYIPLVLSNEQGSHCEGYWIIAFGNLSTMKDSLWTELAYAPGTTQPVNPEYANWPNFPPPYGDGNPNTPPIGIEIQVKKMVFGALEVRGNIFEDQLKLFEK